MAGIDEFSLGEQPLEWDTPLFRTAVAQYEEALTHADVDPGAAERMRYPEIAVMVSVPVRMDNGDWAVFPGYRVLYSSVIGPTRRSMKA